MSAVSSVGGGSPVYRPTTAAASKPKPANPPAVPQGGGGDRDHDGDSDGGGLDVKG